MNFSLLHEALRLELLRRIDRGALTGKLLAQQAGLKQAHISNFLHRRRMLSMGALDKVLVSQNLSIVGLLVSYSEAQLSPQSTPHGRQTVDVIPLVSQASAIHEPSIRPGSVIDEVRLPPGVLDRLQARCTPQRRQWQRFVAVRITALQAKALTPVLNAHAIVCLDRHVNVVSSAQTGQPTLYAVSYANSLSLRYVSINRQYLVLRPYGLDHPVKLLEVPAGKARSDYIVGRVFFTMSGI